MEFFARAPGAATRLGVLPGTFNPPTRAHLALAKSALAEVDEVLFVLPRVFPHKDWEGASFAQRMEMLGQALRDEPRCSIAASTAGLFDDIARECRQVYGAGTRLSFICGSDAADRIAHWDYGRPGAFAEMLASFDLLVASRLVPYVPPEEWCTRIRPLPLAGDFTDVSATEVRRRIAHGEPWSDLVPESIVPLVSGIYAR